MCSVAGSFSVGRSSLVGVTSANRRIPQLALLDLPVGDGVVWSNYSTISCFRRSQIQPVLIYDPDLIKPCQIRSRGKERPCLQNALSVEWMELIWGHCKRRQKACLWSLLANWVKFHLVIEIQVTIRSITAHYWVKDLLIGSTVFYGHTFVREVWDSVRVYSNPCKQVCSEV